MVLAAPHGSEPSPEMPEGGYARDDPGVLRKLFGGRLGYEHVATFHRRGLPATELIPTLNPRIVILRRRRVAAADAGALCA